MIMEGDPFVLIEGMTIAGFAVGATERLYLHPLRISARVPDACGAPSTSPTRKAIWARTSPAAARASIWKCGWARALTSAAKKRRCSKAWKASAARSASSRLCRPSKGLFGKPTVVNNVISLATVPIILDKGAEFYQRFRHGQIARHADHPTRRQHQARRPGGKGLRTDAARSDLRFRRRHGYRPSAARGAGRRAAGRVFPRIAARYAAGL